MLNELSRCSVEIRDIGRFGSSCGWVVEVVVRFLQVTNEEKRQGIGSERS